jgi:uncharacterized protein (DUF2236 family)
MGVRARATRMVPDGVPGLRPAVRAGMTEVFGPVPFDPSRDVGDPGLHGPGSATWRVIGEPAAILGGVRGLLVQLLHPLAMAGVADHSAFETDALGRLRRTSAYVTTTAFGSLDETLEAVRAVRRRHVPVRGHAPDGRPYRAEEPGLLAWVSIALTESFLATDEVYAPVPCTRAQADAFVLEQSRIAALLDPRVDLERLASDAAARRALRDGTLALPMVDDGVVPRDLEELRRHMAEAEAGLGLNDQGRRAIAFLESPPLDGVAARVYPTVLEAALATIPEHRRRRCGWPVASGRDRRARARGHALLGLLRLGAGRLESVAVAERRVGRPPRAPSPGAITA